MFPDFPGFPAPTPPVHDTTGTSALLQDYYADAIEDPFIVALLDYRTAMFGTDQAETVTGTSAHEVFDGNVADLTNGGDTLLGGDGNDLYFISDSQTRLMELDGEGDDTVVTNVDFDFMVHGDGQGNAASIERVEVQSGANVVIDASGSTGSVWIDATKGGDVEMHAGSGGSQLRGGDGDNDMFGGAGTDKFRGGAGNDLMEGGAGNDIFWGDEGNDTMDGGAGSDEFIFFHSDGPQHDVIRNFETGVDDVTIWDADMFNFSFAQTAEGILLTYGQERSILFEDAVFGEVNFPDFSFESDYLWL